MGQTLPLIPLLAFLGGYFVLQIGLNLIAGLILCRATNRALTALRLTFTSTIINALYFITAAVLLHVYGWAPNNPPKANYGWLALIGLPLGLLLWYAAAWGRKLGLSLFGRSELIPAEDAALHIAARPGSPLNPRFIGWGVVNLVVLQPLGRELFLRGAFLPAVAEQLDWVWAVAATLLVELLLRLNVVWLFQTLAYSLVVCAAFILTGSALSGLIAAAVSGLIHALALVYIAGRNSRPDVRHVGLPIDSL